MATKKAKAEAASPKRRRRGVTLQPTELEAPALRLEAPPDDVREIADAVAADGGSVLCAYREPLGGHTLLLVALPIEKIAPTPFQRDVSDAHVRRLVHAMDKTRRFLDPVIAVRHEGKYFTPNGNHRLTALRELGARCIVALLVPERAVAYQILALNIEKAHNLRERALEVVRMVRDLAGWSTASEKELEIELEDPSLVTLGFAYEARPRLSGGAYASALKKVDGWVDGPLAQAIPERERRAKALLSLDDAVSEAVTRLREKGLQSPYLKAFVVARCNPLRFIKGEPPAFDELLETMTKRAKGLELEGIRAEDLARSGGPTDEAAE